MSKKLRGTISRETEAEITRISRERGTRKSKAIWYLLKVARDNDEAKKQRLKKGKRAIAITLSSKHYDTLVGYIRKHGLKKGDILEDAIARAFGVLGIG